MYPVSATDLAPTHLPLALISVSLATHSFISWVHSGLSKPERTNPSGRSRVESCAADFSHKSYSMSWPLQDAHKKREHFEGGWQESEEKYKGTGWRWGMGVILFGGFSWSHKVKGRAGQRTRGRREAESKGGAGREQRRKLASCFHSWDIQSNEPSF